MIHRELIQAYWPTSMVLTVTVWSRKLQRPGKGGMIYTLNTINGSSNRWRTYIVSRKCTLNADWNVSLLRFPVVESIHLSALWWPAQCVNLQQPMFIFVHNVFIDLLCLHPTCQKWGNLCMDVKKETACCRLLVMKCFSPWWRLRLSIYWALKFSQGPASSNMNRISIAVFPSAGGDRGAMDPSLYPVCRRLIEMHMSPACSSHSLWLGPVSCHSHFLWICPLNNK